MMKNIRECLWTTILGLTLCIPAARGQQPDPQSNPPVQPQPPLPAGKTIIKLPGLGETIETESTTPDTPDTRPLSGAEQFTLGQMGKRRSFLLTGFAFFEMADTNAAITSTPSSIETTSTLLGHLALRRIWSRYEFRTEYRGGGILYPSNSNLDTTVQDLTVEQRIAGRRWKFLLDDRFSYLPESSFGFTGFGSTQSNLDTGLATLNPVLEPNQAILTGRTSRISNTAVGQVEHIFGRKSSFTASASYGILRFENNSNGVNTGFVNNSNAIFQAGYNYALSTRNTLSLSYGFSMFRFPDQAQQIYDHILRVAYGRRITGRLALQLSGGPDLYMFRNALAGSSQRLSWGQESALLYGNSGLRRTNLRISYATYLSGGAGVVSGAQSHNVRLTVEHRLSRIWSSSLNLGFARSTSLAQTTVPAANTTAFNAWYGNVNLARPVGRYMNLLLNFAFQQQNSNTSLCGITICGTVPARYVFGLGFNWHHQQIPLG